MKESKRKMALLLAVCMICLCTWPVFADTTNRYYIIFDANGGTGHTIGLNSYAFGTEYTLPPANNSTTEHDIYRKGYIFAGWSLATDGEVEFADKATFSDLASEPGETVTLYAVWNPGQSHYKALYYTQNLDGTYHPAGSEGLGTAETESTILVYPSRNYSGFQKPDPQEVTITASPTVAVEFYYDRLSYELTWDLSGGTTSDASYTPNGIYLYETPITAPQELTRPGYTFARWNTTVPKTMPASNVTYRALWNSIPYDITYYLDGGYCWSNPDWYYISSEDITLYPPEKDGYTFSGWTGTDVPEATMSVTIPHGSMGNRSYTAHWIKNPDPEPQPEPEPPKPHTTGSSRAALFTGTSGNPVTNGIWSYDAATDSWFYATTRRFTDTWAYIANPYAGNEAGWFYFDKDGKMLTGWNWLFWNGIRYCFYLNPISDNWRGRCQLGGITPDGYTLDASGAWTVNGVIQTTTHNN